MKSITATIVMLSIFVIGCEPKPKTESEKRSYALGVQVAKSTRHQGTDLDGKFIAQAVQDVLTGSELKLSEAEIQAALLAMSKKSQEESDRESQANLSEGQKFFDDYIKKYSAKVTPKGVAIRVVKNGSGPVPNIQQVVRMHYEGRLIDGKVFDSSRMRGNVAEFPVRAVIPGWSEVLTMMPVGSRWEVAIPARLAYGETGNQLVPRNSTLVFDLELLGVK